MDPTANQYNRVLSAALHLGGCVIVGVAGFWLQGELRPRAGAANTPNLMPFLPLFCCFVVWLASLIYLLGCALSGRRSPLWQSFVLPFLGLFIGLVDGFIHAWVFGAMVGMLSGLLIGAFVFVLRRRSTSHGD